MEEKQISEWQSLQNDFLSELRNSMTRFMEYREKKDGEGTPLGMPESLFFSIMWAEFCDVYKQMFPSEYTENREFLQSLFTKIMNGEGPMEFAEKRMGKFLKNTIKNPTIN